MRGAMRLVPPVLALTLALAGCGPKRAASPKIDPRDLLVQTHPQASATLLLAAESFPVSFERHAREAGMPEKDLAERVALLRKALDPDTMFADVIAAIRERGGADHLAAVGRFAHSETSDRLQDAWRKTLAAAGDPSAQAAAAAWWASPPAEERVKLVRSVDRASHETDLVIDISHQIESLADEAARLDPGQAPLTDEQRTKGREMFQALELETRPAMLSAMIYAFRDVGDDDLRAAQTFWESDDGRWYVEGWQAGIDRAFKNARKRLDVSRP
jgi:hypothetical protein